MNIYLFLQIHPSDISNLTLGVVLRSHINRKKRSHIEEKNCRSILNLNKVWESLNASSFLLTFSSPHTNLNYCRQNCTDIFPIAI